MTYPRGRKGSTGLIHIECLSCLANVTAASSAWWLGWLVSPEPRVSSALLRGPGRIRHLLLGLWDL